jgi:hypothetical protein
MASDDAPNVADVAAALSPDRLAPYLRAAGGDLDAALRLYEWNLSVSGAMYEALGILEVVLRNALSTQLANHHGTLAGHWFDDPLGVLSDVAHEDIAAARYQVRKMRRPETPGRVIAELNFGFWKYLLAKRYEATLWTGYLRHAFPDLQPQRRITVFNALDELHGLRNRVAHHEPIHRRNLTEDMLTLYRMLDWINAGVREWAVKLSRLQSVIATKPTAP